MARPPESGSPTLADWLQTHVAEDAPAPDAGPALPRLKLTEDARPDADLALKDVLGVGGMAVVTRAEQTALGRDVAVKRSRHLTNPRSVHALLREAWITGQLDHPNVVPVHLVGETDEGEPIVVLRAIGGQSWNDRLADDPADDPEALARHLAVFAAVCNAVHYAHEQGFLHRDIKPANVQIGSFGEVYLLDWGVAAALDEPVLRRAGTPAYMAPEMLDRCAPDRRSDVFLLGATLAEVVSGEPPRDGVATEEILSGAREAPPLALPDALPPGLRPILERACAPDPADRHPTAAALRDAVLAWQVDLGLASLLEAALGRLDELESVAAEAVARPEEEALALDARERFAAVRFGLEQVLGDRPEHPEATAALGRGLEAMIRVELAHGSATGARAFLAAHPDPSPSFTAEVEQAIAALDARRAEQARLAKVAAQYDTTEVARDWITLIALTAVALFVGIVGTNTLVDTEGLSDGLRSTLLIGPAAATVVAVLLWKRRTLWQHPAGRRLSGTVAGLLGVVVVNRIAQILAGVDPDRFAIGEPFLVAVWLFGCTAWLRQLLPVALFCLAGAAINAQLVDSPWSAFLQNSLILTVATWVAVVWWRVLSHRDVTDVPEADG